MAYVACLWLPSVIVSQLSIYGEEIAGKREAPMNETRDAMVNPANSIAARIPWASRKRTQ